MEKILTGETDFDRFKVAAGNMAPVADVASLMPPTMEAAMTYKFNKDFWSKQDIWKGREGISPKNEYWNTTNRGWVAIGEMAEKAGIEGGVSPVRAERAFKKVVPESPYSWLGEAFWSEAFGQLDEKDKEEFSKPFLQRLTESPFIRKYVRATLPAGKKWDGLLEQADKLNLPTSKPNMEPMSYSELKRAIDKAKSGEGDKRIMLDREFDFLAAKSMFDKADGGKELDSKLKELRETDFAEYKRVLTRVRRKYPDALEGTVVMKRILEKPQDWREAIQFQTWWKQTGNPTKEVFRKEFGPKFHDKYQALLKAASGRTMQESLGPKRKVLQKQYREGAIPKAEYDRRLAELQKEMREFAEERRKMAM